MKLKLRSVLSFALVLLSGSLAIAQFPVFTSPTGYKVSGAQFSSAFSLRGPDGTQSAGEVFQTEDIQFNSIGTKMYAIDDSQNKIVEYNLSSPYAVSTAVYSGAELSVQSEPGGFTFSDDGTKLFVTGRIPNEVKLYNLTSAFDLSTATATTTVFSPSTQEGSPEAIVFGASGSKMFITGGSKKVTEYELSTPFDITSITGTPVQFDVASSLISGSGSPSGLVFNRAGSKMYISSTDATPNSKISVYSLSNFSLATASYDGSASDFVTSSQERRVFGITLSSYDDRLIITGGNTGATAYDFTLPITTSFPENSTDNVSSINANDGGGGADDTSVTYGLSGDDATLFSISASGALSFVSAPDFESPADNGGNNVYNVTVTANNGTNTSSQKHVITVTNIAPTITSATSASIPENSTAVIYTATANESVTYSLGTENDESFFTLSTDAISFTTPADFEDPKDANSGNDYIVEIIAADAAGNEGTLLVTISVSDVDDIAPTITSATSAIIPENSTAVIYTATANESVTYSLGTENDESFFTLSTDAISFTTPADFEDPQDANFGNDYLLEIIATDAAGNEGTLLVTISVSDVDDSAPTITSATSASIPENSTAVIYTATANESVTYSLGTENDESFFTLSTDAISFTTPADFEVPQDGNSDNAYLVEIMATDNAENISSKMVTITVTNVVETLAQPTDLIAYQSAGNVVLEWVDNSDSETGFKVERADDYGFTTNVTDITVGAGSPGADAVTATYNPSGNAYFYRVIAVNTEAETPSEVEFATPADFSATGLRFGGNDDEINIGNDASLSFGGQTDITIEAWVKVDAINQLRTIVAKYDFPSASAYEYIFRIDQGNPSLILQVEGAAIILRSGIILSTGKWYHLAGTYDGANLKFYVNGVETASLAETRNIVSKPTVVTSIGASNPGSEVFSGDMDEVKIWSVAKTDFSDRFSTLKGDEADLVAYYPFDEGAGTTVVDRSKNNNVGSFTIGGIVGGFVPTDFIAPEITSGSTASIVENSAGVIYTATADESVTYSLGSTNDESFFTLSTDAISFTTPADFEDAQDGNSDNDYVVEVIATDAAGNEGTLLVTISVTDVDEIAPTITSGSTASIVENSTAVIYTATADESVTYSLGTENDESFFTLSTDAISFTTAADFEDPQDGNSDNDYIVELIATDAAGNSGREMVTIAVTNGDDAPIFESDAAFEYFETLTAAVVDVNANDGDGGAVDVGITYSLSGEDAAVFTINSNTGVLTFNSPPDFDNPQDAGGDNIYDVTVTASDGNLTADQDIFITVLDGGENAPVFTAPVGFDVSKAEFSASNDFFSSAMNPTGMVFSADGSIVFIANQSSVVEIPLNTSFDVSTANTGSLVSLNLGNFQAEDLTFNNDGTKLLMIGSNFDFNTSEFDARVVEYDLSSAYSITGATAGSFISVNNEEDFVSGFEFNPDGTTMFVIGKTNKTILEYSLSTGFDVSTISYTSRSFDASSELGGPEDIIFNGSGSVCYIVDTNFSGQQSVTIIPFDLISAYSLSVDPVRGASSQELNVSFSDIRPTGSTFSPVGTKFYLIGPDNSGAPIRTYDIPVGTSIVENSLGVAADVDANNGDGGAMDAVFYSLQQGGDNDLFDINPAGQLSFKSPANFENPSDADADNFYEVTVFASDIVSLSSISFSIEVTDVGEILWSGNVSADWNNTANWQGGVLPTASDDVVIPSGISNAPVLNAGVYGETNSLEIQNGATLTIESSGSLKIMGAAFGEGQAIAKKKVNGNLGYSMIGSTMEFINVVTDLSPQPDYFYTYFEPTDTYFEPTIMLPAIGTFIAYDAAEPTVILTGTPNSGEIEVTLSKTGSELDEFNLIANPYNAAIDRSALIAANSDKIGGSIYIWDDGGSNVGNKRGGGYLAINDMGVTNVVDTDNVSGNTGKVFDVANDAIGSMQGFYVLAEGENGDTFSFTPEMQLSAGNADANFFRKAAPSKSKITLALSGNGFYQETIIGTHEKATSGRDHSLDAPYLESFKEFSLFSLMGDKRYAIQAVPRETEKVHLGFDVRIDGAYSLSVVNIDNFGSLSLILRDIETGNEYKLEEGSKIPFSVLNPQMGSQRFELVFNASRVLELEDSNADLIIFGNESDQTISYQSDQLESVTIFSLSGQKIFEEQVQFVEGKGRINARLNPAQLYVVRINEKAVKFILK